MVKLPKYLSRLFAALLGLLVATTAAAASLDVSSSNPASWQRSNGGTGTAMPIGGPGVWNSQFTATIPPGATNIAFTLDSFSVDDKGVVQMNGGTIGDAVIFQPNGGAAGAGTFDFGGGNQAYTYVGFTPGAAIGLPDGTTDFNLTVYVNDTGTSNPSAPPTGTVTVASSFNLSGTLTYDVGGESAAVPTMPGWGLLLLVALLAAAAGIGIRFLGTRRGTPPG